MLLNKHPPIKSLVLRWGFSFALNDQQVKGFIDRLERTADGEHVVIDYKTGVPYRDEEQH